MGHIPPRYKPETQPNGVVLRKGQWDRSPKTGIRRPTVEIALWCADNTRAGWRPGNVVVGRDPKYPNQTWNEFGITFDDPADALLFKMRWSD